jgi:hypothetical protein
MNKTMTRTVLAAVAAVALAGAISAQAQLVTKATAQIPFTFSVGSSGFSAGKCEITLPYQMPHVVLLKCDEARNGVMVLTSPVGGVLPIQQSKLIFNRYGDRYFLSEIWIAGRAYGHRLSRSKVERELAVAQRGSQQIVLALR